MADYLFPGKKDNAIHDITLEDIHQLSKENFREEIEGRIITKSTYQGESYIKPIGTSRADTYKESLYRIPKTAGVRVQWPHGIVIKQSQRRSYYRGENQVFDNSVSSLIRKLQDFTNEKDRELYRLVSDMRIAEFSCLLNQLMYVKNWKFCDILYETLAQHYGIETGWLDITTDFNVAMFFATCYFDRVLKKWMPLTKKQTETDNHKKYGMIFRMPSNHMLMRWGSEIDKFDASRYMPESLNKDNEENHRSTESPLCSVHTRNLIYPIGFQPFMRCHMQEGYGIYMRNAQPLECDTDFEKLRFRHNEKLSQSIFDLMQGGKQVTPHEGVSQLQFLIDEIANQTVFSDMAFQYALKRSHYYRIADEVECREDLSNYYVNGRRIHLMKDHPWKISRNFRRKIDRMYQSFDVQEKYGLQIIDRFVIPPGKPMFEPWMLPEKDDERGTVDFCGRKMEGCYSLWYHVAEMILSTVENGKIPEI